MEARRPRSMQHELIVDVAGKNTVIMDCGIRYGACTTVEPSVPEVAFGDYDV